MFLTKIGATININSTFTCFYQPFNLVDFLCEYLQHDIIKDGIDEREQQLLLRKILKPIWLETHHTESVRKYRIRGFGASARQHTFPRIVVDGGNGDNQERQSVLEYFREKYNIILRFPNLPTVGKTIFWFNKLYFLNNLFRIIYTSK
jgi:eukaryotic translation initiation factor 2C